MTRRVIVAVLVGATLVGCAPAVWIRSQGQSEQQFMRDSYRCELEARHGSGLVGLTGRKADGELYRRCMESQGYAKKTVTVQPAGAVDLYGDASVPAN